MKRTVFFLEVGVEIKDKKDDFENYNCTVMGKEKHLWDENTILFFDLEKAKKEGLDYVNKGVENTYAMIWDSVENLTDEDIKEIETYGYCDSLDYSMQDIIWFESKEEA